MQVFLHIESFRDWILSFSFSMRFNYPFSRPCLGFSVKHLLRIINLICYIHFLISSCCLFRCAAYVELWVCARGPGWAVSLPPTVRPSLCQAARAHKRNVSWCSSAPMHGNISSVWTPWWSAIPSLRGKAHCLPDGKFPAFTLLDGIYTPRESVNRNASHKAGW